MLKKILSLMIAAVMAAASIRTVQPQSAASAKETEGYRIQILESDDRGLTLELSVENYSLVRKTEGDREYDFLKLTGAVMKGQPGSPEIPFVPALVGAPPGVDIELEIVSVKSRSIGRAYHLPPIAVPAPIKDELTPGLSRRIPEPVVYESSDRHPQTPALVGEDAVLRDRRLVRLELYPFQYIPLTGELILNQTIRVRVDFIETDRSQELKHEMGANDSIFDAALESMLLNYPQARNWSLSPVSHLSAAESQQAPEDLPGSRYRIAISEDGLYRLTYANLSGAGLDLANLDPATFKIENQGDEIAIYVHDAGAQGVFEEGDYIAFYGEKFRGDRMANRYATENEYWYTYWRQLPDGTGELWKPEMDAAQLEKYTDENVYWLSFGGMPGLRMQILSGAPGAAPVPSAYTETIRMEQDNHWRSYHFTSTETWFWEFLNSNKEISRTYTVTLDSLAAAPVAANLRGEILALISNIGTSPDHQVSLYLNDTNQSGLPIHEFEWDGGSMYAFEAAFDSGVLLEGENQFGLKVHDTPALAVEQMFFDWFEISYPREFQARSNRLSFSMQSPGPWKYSIGGYTSGDVGVLETSDPLAPGWITGWTYASGTLQFQHGTQAGDAFYAGIFDDIPAAEIEYYQPPAFTTAADYVFITHEDFISGLQPLVALRASQGLSTQVVDIQDLYNQFNDGIYNPIAVKNFLAYAFANWSSPPVYVLLVGDGHWNFKGSPFYNSPPIFMPPYLSWVDPWQGEVDSLNLLATVVGDDPLADVLIGRLPVNNQAELTSAVNKTIAYESSLPSEWSKKILFVADNSPDPAGNFPALADEMISTYVQGTMDPLRIYEDDYGCLDRKKCPQVNHAITTTLNTTGTLIANYIGHASVNRWAHEFIFVNDDIGGLTNISQLPVVLSLTCLDGYWLHPGQTGETSESIIEDLVRAGSGGAVAAFSPTGLGVATGHDALHRGFYDSLFVNADWKLGMAAQSAKLRLFASGGNFDLLHTFTIFGDPALHIASPYQLGVTPGSISRGAGSGETIKFSVGISNTGLLADQYEIDIAGATWPVTVVQTTGLLNPGENEVVEVTVQIPAGLPDGQSDEATLIVTSMHDKARTLQVQMLTFVAGHQIFMPEIHQAASGG